MQVTPENAGKWGSVERTQDVMDWSGLDAAYALAKDNGFPFKWHVLIWGNQQPSWLESLSTEDQREEIEEWFSLIAARYDGIDFTELDIDGSTDAIQLADYQRIFPVFWEHPAVEGITLWGYRPGLWRNEQKAYLINPDGTERPALIWLREYVTGVSNVKERIKTLDISLFPNPVKAKEGVLSIASTEPINFVRFFDEDGKMAGMQKVTNPSEIKLPSTITPGTYLIQVYSEQQFSSMKIVVE